MQINVVVMSGIAAADVAVREVGDTGTMKASFFLDQFEHYTHKGEKKIKKHSVQVECWGPVSKVAAQYVGKGKQLTVKGELQTSSWKSDDGTWNNRVFIKADSIDLLGEKRLPGTVDENF